VDYVLPGNDDAIRAVRLYIFGAAEAVLDGRTTAAAAASGEGEFVEVEAGPPVLESSAHAPDDPVPEAPVAVPPAE